MAGHVYIVRGDISKLRCDGWLLPGDTRGYGSRWRSAVAPHYAEPGTARPTESRRCVPLRPIGTAPPAYVTHGWEARAESLTTGTPSGSSSFSKQQPSNWASGAPNSDCAPAHSLPFPQLVPDGVAEIPQRFAAAFCATSRISCARATSMSPLSTTRLRRTPLRSSSGSLSRVLPPGACRRSFESWATSLRSMRAVDRSRCSVGAGVSKSAGLPSWEGLLRQLAGECDLPEDVHAFGYLDRATLIRTAYERARGEGTFRRRIADFLRASHHTLAHSLLASIGAREMVTTNYDELLELAWLGLGPENALSVLPWEVAGAGHPWLLKLHGCISRPQTIVLERSDYLRYANNRAALKGIVQSLMFTRHLLFVGFSLANPNFAALVDEVRQAMGGGPPGPKLGTACLLGSSRLAEQLWPDLAWRDFAPGEEGADVAQGALMLEELLDYVAARSADASAHFLDPAFARMFAGQDAEATLREKLLRFTDSLDDREMRLRSR